MKLQSICDSIITVYKKGVNPIKTYVKDKVKSIVFSVAIVLLFVIIMVTLAIMIINIDKKYIPGVLMMVAIYFFIMKFIPGVINETVEIVELSEKDIAFHNIKTVRIPINEIQKVQYKGVKLIPFTEKIVISSEDKHIRIDYNFKNYLYVWNDIVNTLLSLDSKADIDVKLLDRLHIKH